MKTINLTNYDKVDIFEDEGNVHAFKKTKNGKQVVNKLNVSRNMGNCSHVNAIALSNSAFYIIWLNKTQCCNKIYGRRYTPQGLAGKICEFSIEKKPKLKDLKIELKDDLFIVLTWTANDGNVYKKIYNQDAESKSEEMFVAKEAIDEGKKNFTESEENIKYKIVYPPIVENKIAKFEEAAKSDMENVAKRQKNLLMPIKSKPLNIQSVDDKSIVLSEQPVLPLISRRELIFKPKRRANRGTMRMKFK